MPVLSQMLHASRNDIPLTGNRSIAAVVHRQAPTQIQPPGRETRWPVPVRRNTGFVLQPDWPILQSQSLSRSYGSVLPTSLTYIILETRGYSPWRPAADIGTAQGRGKVFAIEFSRADSSAPDPARTAGLFGVNIHISRQAVFMESTPYREKTTLPGTAADVFDFDCVAAFAPRRRHPLRLSSGILTRCPFGKSSTVSLLF